MGRGAYIALSAVQIALLGYAGVQLFHANGDENRVNAFTLSVPWIIFALVALLLVPALVRLGWRRFGRWVPTWIVAAIISTMSWVVATMLCWMALGIVLILSD